MTLTPDLLVSAYAQGAFPMADADGEIGWYAPDPRAVLPLDGLRVPRSLAQAVRQERYRVAVDADVEATIRACAAPAADRPETWISEEIVSAYAGLARLGLCHSVECHDADGFAGGLYGVALGGAFFGESMVSLRRDASKVALVHLVERLRAGGFVLLDVQMTSPHLARLGVVEIRRRDYQRRLAAALRVRADWHALDAPAPGQDRARPGVEER